MGRSCNGLFIELPVREGFYASLVIVDRLCKLRHLIPWNKPAHSMDVARMYLDHVWKLHGLRLAIVSDCGHYFT